MKTAIRIFFCAIVWASGCTTQEPSVRSWVDQKTAVSVTAQDAPLVLARDDFERGVNIRDYAELSAIEVNRSGKRRLYLAVVAWSTIPRDAEQLRRIDLAFAHVKLWADDRPLELGNAQSRAAIDVNTRPVDLPSPTAREFYYAIEAKELQALAASTGVVLEDAEQNSYRIWRDRRSDLQAFLRSLPVR